MMYNSQLTLMTGFVVQGHIYQIGLLYVYYDLLLDASFYRAYLTQTQTCKHEIKTICTFIVDNCKIPPIVNSTKWICLKCKRVVRWRPPEGAIRHLILSLRSQLLCPPYWMLTEGIYLSSRRSSKFKLIIYYFLYYNLISVFKLSHICSVSA